MCLACSTPVRGQAYGNECLGAVIGSDAPTEPETTSPGPDAAARTLSAIAFGLVVAATALPWSRFGPGSEMLGAWSRTARWSVVAAIAAVAGLALVLAQRGGRLRSRRGDAIATGLGAIVVVASLLAVLFPPAFSRPWLGPWVAVFAGVLACGSSMVAARTVAKSSALTV